MKKSMIIFVCAIFVGAAYWTGRFTSPNYPHVTTSHNVNNADGILAYQHYYECAEEALKDVTITNTDLAKDYDLAKKQLEDYYAGHIMTWPEVCDQRDMLSDIIRKYADEENNNIMEYVGEYFDNPSILKGWRYSYD